MKSIPDKLAVDGIVEALLEVRFETSGLPELVIGQLANVSKWKGHTPVRLPAADIPAPIRSLDKGVRFQPLIQLNGADGHDVVKIGEHVISRHALVTYPGWEAFRPRLVEVLQTLFQQVADFRPTRLGFRYINLLNDRHYIDGLQSLDLSVSVADSQLHEPFNLNFRRRPTDAHDIMMRIASPEFVTSSTTDFKVLIDVDVFTEASAALVDLESCLAWLDDAHILLKKAFFELLREETIDRLKVER